MDVERIGNRDPVGQNLAQGRGARRRQGGKIQLHVARHVGRHRHVAARRTHDQDLAAGERAAYVEELESFAQRTQGIAAGNSGLAAKRLEHHVRARQRSGVAVRGARCGGSAAGLDDGDGLARRSGLALPRAQIAPDP